MFTMAKGIKIVFPCFLRPCTYARNVIKSLLDEADIYEKQCMIYHNWMLDLLAIGKRIINISYHNY